MKRFRKLAAVAAVFMAMLMSVGCVSEAFSAGREVTGVVWDGTKWVTGQVWDGTKWAGKEVYYGTVGNRPERLDLGQEIYASSDHAAAYIVDPDAREYLGFAFDLGRDRKKNAGKGELTTDEVDWILWMLDGPDKDLIISGEDARLGYTEVVNQAAASVANPIGIPTGRGPKAAPVTPSWIKN